MRFHFRNAPIAASPHPERKGNTRIIALGSMSPEGGTNGTGRHPVEAGDVADAEVRSGGHGDIRDACDNAPCQAPEAETRYVE